MVDLQSAKHVFILGVKGVAMAQIAIILKKMGKNVLGYDVKEEFITDEELKKNNIQVVQDLTEIQPDAIMDLCIFSAAHGGDSHPIIQHFASRGVTIVSQAEFLGSFFNLFRNKIAVCGAHGKTTTSSLLSYSLIKLGVDPSYIIGSSAFDSYPGGDFNGKEYIVLEADEYGVNPPHDKTPKFLSLKPTLTLCTNIDFDHPDVFDSLDDVQNGYEKFFSQSEYVIYCADSDPLTESVKKSGVTSDSYGFSDQASHRIINHEVTEHGSKFDILYGDKLISDVHISLYGDHNILNAAGVFLVLFRLGFTEEKIKKAVEKFSGAKRRFEVVYQSNGATLLDDYAHHPIEIKALVKAATERYGKKPVIIFQPHTFSRTEKLLEEFSTAFNGSAYTLLLPIFASAREHSSVNSVTSEVLAQKVKDRGNEAVEAFSSKETLLTKLRDLPERSVIITVGAGDVYKLKNDIIRVLES